MSAQYRPITAEDSVLLAQDSAPSSRRAAFDSQFPPPSLVNRDFSRYNLLRIKLSARDLTGVDFTGSNLSRADLSRCVLTGAKFKKTNLTGASFKSCVVSGLVFDTCDLSDAKFKNVRFITCSFFACKFDDTEFYRAELDRCTFVACTHDPQIIESSFNGSQFHLCDMTHITIHDSMFDRVEILNCEFTNGVLSGSTTFNDAIITDVDMTNAEINWDDYLDIFDGTILDNVRGVPENVPQGVIIGSPRMEPDGIAYEIHNANARINMDKLKAILGGNQPMQASTKAMVDNFNRALSFIASNHQLFHDANQKQNDLHAIATRLMQSEYSRNHDTIEMVCLAFNYVFRQPTEFIVAYMEAFIEDCAYAYSSGADNMSCVNGIIERTYFSIFEAMRVICPTLSADCLTEEQQALAAVFGVVDLADAASKWFDTNEGKPELQNMNAAELKARFIDDIKKLHSSLDQWTVDKITKYADTLDYAFNNKLQLGGRKKAAKKTRSKARSKAKKTRRRRRRL